MDLVPVYPLLKEKMLNVTTGTIPTASLYLLPHTEQKQYLFVRILVSGQVSLP